MLTILAAFGIAFLCFGSGYVCHAVVAQKEAQAKADVQQLSSDAQTDVQRIAVSAADAIQTVATDVTKAL